MNNETGYALTKTNDGFWSVKSADEELTFLTRQFAESWIEQQTDYDGWRDRHQ